MKKVGLGIFGLLLLAALSIWVMRQETSSTMTSEVSNFAFEDTASVDRIILRDETGDRVVLTRDGADWLLNDQYKARPDAIKILLTTIKKVSVRAPISQQEMNTVLKNIIASHTLMEVYSNGELVKHYYVGGPDKDHTGTYMLMKDAQRPFLAHIEGFHGFLTPRFFTNTYEWRHRGVFEYLPEEIQSIELAFTETPERNVTIQRLATGDIEVLAGSGMQPAMNVDSFMVNAYLSNYRKVHYESFEETKSVEFIDSVKASTPFFRLTVTDVTGMSREVSGFRKPLKEGYDPSGNPIDYDLDRLYIWIDSNEMVIAQYAIFDKLTKGINFFTTR